MDDELLKDFLIEAGESIDALEQHLLSLETSPSDKDLINAVFRGLHTIKGTAGFLDLSILESVTHVGETLLDEIRCDRIPYTDEVATTLFELLDAVRNTLTSLQEDGTEGTNRYDPLREKLQKLAGAKENTPSTTEDIPVESDTPDSSEAEHDPTSEEELLRLFEEAQAQYDTEPAKEGDKGNSMPSEDAKPSEKVPPAQKQSSTPSANRSSGETSIRIDIGLVDNLLNTVGELVLTRNQIMQHSQTIEDRNFLTSIQRLNHITTELQEQIMRTRLQPISIVWNKFPRVVRDISKMCSKQVKVKMIGEDTDLDKTIIEALKDPLTHIIRNSVDHGVEDPKAREAKGKNPVGTITLRAYHEGGYVIIEVEDDGAGLNRERILEKAIERKIISADQATTLGDSEVYDFIFHPGFSTAAQLSNISGRGVGMDVVRSNIQRIGGSVEMRSVFGEGTVLHIRIPLTLAIIPALLVSHGKQRFAIPQVAVSELFKVEGEEIFTRFEDLHGATFIRLRESLLPLLYLGRELGLPPKNQEECPPEEASLTVAVVKANNQAFGLVIDQVSDFQEIVVKALGSLLQNLSIYAGATVLGDGCVALILDVAELADKGGIAELHRQGARILAEEELDRSQESQHYLIARTAGERKVSFPLVDVDRLEEIEPGRIEHSGETPVIQYRGELLPLFHFGDKSLQQKIESSVNPDSEIPDTWSLVVTKDAHGRCGFIVEEIEDIVEANSEVFQSSGSEGSPRTAVLCGKVTEIVDLNRFSPRFQKSVVSSIGRHNEGSEQ